MGSLRVNDLGLFDMHGNIWEWCQDIFGADGDGNAHKDHEENLSVTDEISRVLRGGSFGDLSSDVRSAYRLHTQPATRNHVIVFRLARTLPLVLLTSLPPISDR